MKIVHMLASCPAALDDKEFDAILGDQNKYTLDEIIDLNAYKCIWNIVEVKKQKNKKTLS